MTFMHKNYENKFKYEHILLSMSTIAFMFKLLHKSCVLLYFEECTITINYCYIVLLVFFKMLHLYFRSNIDAQLQKFEKSLEEFYSMCDQVEISLVSLESGKNSFVFKFKCDYFKYAY